MSTAVHWQPSRRSSKWLFVLVVLFVVGLPVAALFVRAKADQLRADAHQVPLTTVQIAAGSEDLDFFHDSRVQREFNRHGFDVQVTPFGSYELVHTVHLSKYDSVFPSGIVAAAEIEKKLGYPYGEVHPFSTLPVILSWKPIIPLLEKIGIATRNPDGSDTFHIASYLAIAAKGMKWSDISGNTVYPYPRQILLKITNPQYSNSGSMFVASAAYLLNGYSMDLNSSQLRALARQIVKAIQPLGELYLTTDDLFQDYLNYKMSGTPLMMGYESEYVGAKLKSQGLPQGAAVMYPDVPVESDHTLVPRTSRGSDVANLIKSDSTLQQIAENTYGFRLATTSFPDDMRKHGIQIPQDSPPVNPPSEAILGDLTNAIYQLLPH
jgi:hypothetical protein